MSVEISASTVIRQLTAGTSIRSLEGKEKWKARSQVSEVSQSEQNKHDDGTWTPASSPQPPKVNTIREVGFADDGTWIFSLNDSTIHRQKVSWDEHWLEVSERVDDHELMIASGCCGHVCPPRFAPQIPVTSASNIKAVALQHYGQEAVYGHVTTNSGRRVLVHITFDVRRPLLITSALKRQVFTIVSITITIASFSGKRQRIWFRMFVIHICMSDLLIGLHLAMRW